MMLRIVAFCVSLCGVALAGLPPVPLNGDWRDVEITAKPHQLRGDAEPGEALAVGALVYRGGIELSSSDPAFGGLSGIVISEDGQRLLAVSDRGQWLEASLAYEDGRLIGASAGRMAAITDKDGVVLAGPIADAEGLARDKDGSLIVSFEREARIDRYRIRKDGRIVFDKPLVTFADDKDAPTYNKGIEAVAIEGSGFVALAEAALPNGAAGFRLNGAGERTPISYAPAKNFSVTDAESEGGDLFVLERAYSKFTGLKARILRARLSGDAIAGELLASFGPLYAIDNLEGIATRADGGRRLIYVVSDDNYSARQKTLLMMFEVTE